jgi:phospholipid/cholesterol/gamma-HCH transport system substrate-binding protein
MENKAYAFAAGLFTLLLGIGVLLAAMWFSGETYVKAFYVLESKYPVTGLNEQAYVRYRGVDIGKVTKIRFDVGDNRIILIDVALDSTLQLTKSAFAELRYQGVTGLSYIQLDDPRTSTERLPPVSEEGSIPIPVRESVFASLADTATEVLADAREVMKRVNTLLSDDNQLQITKSLQAVEAATRQLTSVAQSLEPAAKDSAALVAEARKTFQSADRLLGELATTNRDLAKRLEAIDRVAGSAEKAGTSVASLVDSLSTETVPRINSLAEELARTSRSLDRLATSLKEQPQSLIFGRKSGTPGPGEPGFESRGKGKQ